MPRKKARQFPRPLLEQAEFPSRDNFQTLFRSFVYYTYQLLRILKSNLEKMQNLLSYGDGEAAVKISFENERILFLLEHVKDNSIKSKLAEIQELVMSCIDLQAECDTKLQSITIEYKKELNTHMVKRQVKNHLKNT